MERFCTWLWLLRKKRPETIFLDDVKKETFLYCNDSWSKDYYDKSLKSFWHPNEIDFSQDLDDFETLSQTEQELIKKVTVFFLMSEKIVGENCEKYFLETSDDMYMEGFYIEQAADEVIHNFIYSKMTSIVFPEHEQQNDFVEKLNNMKSIVKKRNFSKKFLKCTDIKQKLIAFSLIEGLFFASSFVIFFWLKKKGKCNGFVTANEWILRDETLHYTFGCIRLKQLKISKLEVEKILEQAVQIEIEYIKEIISTNTISDLYEEDLIEYCKYIADTLLILMGLDKKYNSKQPFNFMNMKELLLKNNFFENRTTTYSKYALENDHFEYNKNW